MHSWRKLNGRILMCFRQIFCSIYYSNWVFHYFHEIIKNFSTNNNTYSHKDNKSYASTIFGVIYLRKYWKHRCFVSLDALHKNQFTFMKYTWLTVEFPNSLKRRTITVNFIHFGTVCRNQYYMPQMYITLFWSILFALCPIGEVIALNIRNNL